MSVILYGGGVIGELRNGSGGRPSAEDDRWQGKEGPRGRERRGGHAQQGGGIEGAREPMRDLMSELTSRPWRARREQVQRHPHTFKEDMYSMGSLQHLFK